VLLGRTQLGLQRIKEERVQRKKQSLSSAETQLVDDEFDILRCSSEGSTGTDASSADWCQDHNMARDDLILGVQLACLPYTNDRHQHALRPLTDTLRGLGYTVDRIFSYPALGSQTVDAYGFIAHNNQDVVLSYRGTTGVIEWLTDLAGSLTQFQPEEARAACCLTSRAQAQVHQGFYDAMKASLPDIETHLMPQIRNQSQPKRLIIVGHGIGGAVAMGAFGHLLQSFDFGASPHRILFVSTGQPRFGDEAFAKWLETEILKLQSQGKCSVARVVNEHDTVPTVPSQSAGFCHAAKLYLLDQDGDLICDPEVEELHDSVSPAEDFEKHRTDHYLKLLSKAACIECRKQDKASKTLAEMLPRFG